MGIVVWWYVSRLVPIMSLYSPLSLAVASNSLFHDVQLSHLSLGFMSLNLWMLCLGGEMELRVACDMVV